MTDKTPLFKMLDGNTLFTVQQFWAHTDDTTGQKEVRECIGTWQWEMVWSVQTMSSNVLPEVEGPRCVIELAGQFLYLRADYQTVLTAWRQYRQRYEKKFQFTPPN